MAQPPILITWFLTKRFTRLRVFSIDLPLLGLCQYRLCNISDHTISIFGIKACIRRMWHIMFSASCQHVTVPRSFDPSCIRTNFGGGCLLKRNSNFGINSFQSLFPNQNPWKPTLWRPRWRLPCLETTSLPAQYTMLDPNIQIEREPII
jgi:hypothetical protein